MSYTIHNAIVVTGFHSHIEAARAEAWAIFCEDSYWPNGIGGVTPLTHQTPNGYMSFMIAPDGSKELWDLSDAGDEARQEFITWLNKQREGTDPQLGIGGLEWAEVQFAYNIGDEVPSSHHKDARILFEALISISEDDEFSNRVLSSAFDYLDVLKHLKLVEEDPKGQLYLTSLGFERVADIRRLHPDIYTLATS